MPKRLSSQKRLHRRDVECSEGFQVADRILFPKAYEDAWKHDEDGDKHRSDFRRARLLIRRIAMVNAGPTIVGELEAIVTNRKTCTIPALATAIQSRIFKDRHTSFATNPLVQCVRFMLIKGRIHQNKQSERTKSVLDFFFDPTLERNLNPLPLEDLIVYQYPARPLKVAIIGGGPTALATAISLAEKGEGKIEVHVYDERWTSIQCPDGSSYVDYPPDAHRRDQVVTLQDHVTSLLSEESYDALFEGGPERVWPGSANIQIRKVEDHFLNRVQDPGFRDFIHLHTIGVTRTDLGRIGDFHILLGADGASSWVRKSYFHEFENEEGKSYALGLAFDRPMGLPWSQPLNVFLTLGQTRYLLNASDSDGRGYLNMQLTEDEWLRMVSKDGQPVHFGRPGCLRNPDGSVPEEFEESQVFAPFENRQSPLWIAISDGLKLFGFREEEVVNVVRIPMVVRTVSKGVEQLPPYESPAIRRPHALVAVAGDAAMTVHFWPGRGLNSGIKSGIALADELVHGLKNGHLIGMPVTAMAQYNDFLNKLHHREQEKRSVPILNQSGSPEMLEWALDQAIAVPDDVAMEWLIYNMKHIADRLQGRPDWAYEPVVAVEKQLRMILQSLNSVTLREMAVSFPWPTKEMAGAEVLPVRSMKSEEKRRWASHLWALLRYEKSKQRLGKWRSQHSTVIAA